MSDTSPVFAVNVNLLACQRSCTISLGTKYARMCVEGNLLEHMLPELSAKLTSTQETCSGLAHLHKKEMLHGSFSYITTFNGTECIPVLNLCVLLTVTAHHWAAAG